LGGIVWAAADDRNVYYGLSSGGMSALKLPREKNLVRRWPKKARASTTRGCECDSRSRIRGRIGRRAAALSTADGKVIGNTTPLGISIQSIKSRPRAAL
jgi:hypothetical protein